MPATIATAPDIDLSIESMNAAPERETAGVHLSRNTWLQAALRVTLLVIHLALMALLLLTNRATILAFSCSSLLQIVFSFFQTAQL